MQVSAKSINNTVTILRNGGIVFMPTDTVCGLIVKADELEAVKRVQILKGRDFRPGTFLFADEQQLIDFGFSPNDIQLASQFWPGPVSVVMPYSGPYLDGAYASFAVRIPADEWLRGVLSKTGPLATTSANITGEPTIYTVAEARKQFGSSVDYYYPVNGIKPAHASKIVKINPDGTFDVLRA